MINHSQKTQSASYSRFLYLILYLIMMVAVVVSGAILSALIPTVWVAVIAGLIIFILLALLATRFIQGLSIFQMPLLILACLVSGFMLGQLTDSFWQVSLATLLLSINLILLLIGASHLSFNFQKFNLLLAILAICFSFVGGILIFIEGNQIIQLAWLFGR